MKPGTTPTLVACVLAMAVGLALTPGGRAEPSEEHLGRARGAAEAGRPGDAIIIGKVSDNPRKHYDYLKPMGDYVASRMSDLGITRAEVLMAPSNEVMIEYLRTGLVDWVTETPFSAIAFVDEAGAELLARKWKKGVPTYRTVFAVRDDSGIAGLKDLAGRTVAFEDEGSTSAFFLPAAALIEAGLEIVRLDSPRDRPPAGTVGFVFSHEEINSAVWLHRGIVDAAVFSENDWNKEDHVPAECRETMRIIHETEEVDRAFEVVRCDLDPAVRDRLRELLLRAHEDPAAGDVLRAYQRTARFDTLGTESLARLERVRQMRHLVLEEMDW